MKARRLIPAVLILLLLCLAAAAASAEKREAKPYTYEILDEETKTAQIVGYKPLNK